MKKIKIFTCCLSSPSAPVFIRKEIDNWLEETGAIIDSLSATSTNSTSMILITYTLPDKEDNWESIGKRCSVNTYNFWNDLKDEFKKEFILIKR